VHEDEAGDSVAGGGGGSKRSHEGAPGIGRSARPIARRRVELVPHAPAGSLRTGSAAKALRNDGRHGLDCPAIASQGYVSAPITRSGEAAERPPMTSETVEPRR
jgi:hypothetical protein